MTDLEREALSLLNNSRIDHGLKVLRRAGLLSIYAHHRARKMARTRTLKHGDPGAFMSRHGKGYIWWGEIIGVGPAGGIWGVHKAFLHSPPHRANILDPRFRQAGIGVVTKGEASWVCEVFWR